MQLFWLDEYLDLLNKMASIKLYTKIVLSGATLLDWMVREHNSRFIHAELLYSPSAAYFCHLQAHQQQQHHNNRIRNSFRLNWWLPSKWRGCG